MCFIFSYFFLFFLSCCMCLCCVLWALVAWNKSLHSFIHSLRWTLHYVIYKETVFDDNCAASDDQLFSVVWRSVITIVQCFAIQLRNPLKKPTKLFHLQLQPMQENLTNLSPHANWVAIPDKNCAVNIDLPHSCPQKVEKTQNKSYTTTMSDCTSVA